MEYKLTEVLLELTKRCNLKCSHCASSCEEDVEEKELDLDEWVEVIKVLAGYGVKKVIFSGGEPTLDAVRLTVLIRAAAENGLEYGVITNGLHVSDFIINTMSAYLPFGVGVSLDGTKATHNEIRCHEESWQRAVRTILDLQDAGIRVCVITALSKKNVGELAKIYQLLESLNVPSWQVQLAMPAGRWANRHDLLISQKEFRNVCSQIVSFRCRPPHMQIEAADCFGMAEAGYIRSKAWSGCGAGLTSMAIDSSGRIMPCLSLRGHFCGSIYDGIVNTWEASPGFDFNRKFCLEKIEGQCVSCELLATCRGGCASQSFFTRGHFHDSPYCYHHRWQRVGLQNPVSPADQLPPTGVDSMVIKYGLPDDLRPSETPHLPEDGWGPLIKYGLPDEVQPAQPLARRRHPVLFKYGLPDRS